MRRLLALKLVILIGSALDLSPHTEASPLLGILVGASPPPQHTTSLHALLSALHAKYARLRSLSAEFVQIYHAPGTSPRREEGTVLLAKPRRMRWHYRHPEEKFFISDGERVYLYVPADREVIRTKLRQIEDIKASFAFFLGQKDVLQLFSRIERLGNPAPLQAGNVVLRFIPKDARLGFSELIAEITPSSLHLVRLSIRELDGARSEFLFFNIRENVAAPHSAFVFSIPPGVRVLEAR